MRALITGTSGQDAKFLMDLLLSKNYKIFALTRPIESDDNFKDIKSRVTLLTGDLLSDLDMKMILKESEPDEVYNLGAISHVGYSFEEPVLTGNTTGLGVVRLLDSIKKFNPKIRFYQASSSEMFGNAQYSPQSEKTTMRPESPYAIAKLYAYHMTRLYREAYGMHCSNGILFNHESEIRGHNFVTRKISYAVAQIALGIKKDKLSMGNIDSMRDWGYARDYVEAMWLMLQQEQADDYVIGTGELHSVRDFLDEAFKLINRDYRNWIEIDKKFYRPSEVNELCADYSKAKAKLGWSPKVKFQELVKLMVEHDIGVLKCQRV